MIIIIKLLVIIAALLVLLRFKIDLAPAILLSGLATIVMFQINFMTALEAAAKSVAAPKTLQLIVVILLVLYIGNIQKSKKMFDRLIDSLNVMLRDRRIVAMVSPAIIGFLPMLGGALFSAPLVDVSTKNMDMKPEFKTFINYWFRHIWEYVWPIYAGLLIFQALSKIPMKQIILYQSPFTILNIATGAIVCFIYFKKRDIHREPPQAAISAWDTAKDFFNGIWPISLAILLYILPWKLLLNHIPSVILYLIPNKPLRLIIQSPLCLALALTAFTLTIYVRLKPKEIAQVMFTKTMARTAILLASVMAFQGIIEASDLASSLTQMNVSVGMIILFSFLISFSMGFLTGINAAYIAIAYPIIFPLIQNLPNFVTLSLYIYIIGFAGILLSPLHLCLVLTNEYFKSSLVKVYKYLIPPVLIMSLIATTLAFVL